MTSYVADAAERASAYEQSEPRVVRDRRALNELRAIVGETEAEA